MTRKRHDHTNSAPARWSLDERFPNHLFSQSGTFAAASVTVRGLRYALPTLSKRVAYIAEEFVGMPVLRAIATMWRLRRGSQPLEESEEHWRQEIDGERVWLRRRVQQASDPEGLWILATVASLVRKGDCVLVVVHHHERVVPAVRPTKLFETADLVVVDKPAGLACSLDLEDSNSLLAVVCEELGLNGLRLAHRLDACVSGCLIMARSKRVAEKCLQEMQGRRARKVYIARVEGELPQSLQLGILSEAWTASVDPAEAEEKATTLRRPSMKIDEPLSYDGHSARAVLDRVYGSPCCTVVKWLTTLSDGTHILHCQPQTGVKHQIRCHLALLGLPIANDQLYGGSRPAFTEEGKYPQLFTDDEAGTLEAALGRHAESFLEWCPKCRETVAVLSGQKTAPELGSAEIWLRSWRYALPAMGVDVVATLPHWAFDHP